MRGCFYISASHYATYSTRDVNGNGKWLHWGLQATMHTCGWQQTFQPNDAARCTGPITSPRHQWRQSAAPIHQRWELPGRYRSMLLVKLRGVDFGLGTATCALISPSTFSPFARAAALPVRRPFTP